MLITILGYFLIPIGLLLTIINPKYLLYFTILFAGFSGAAVVIIGDLGIQPSFYFAILWIVRNTINKKRTKIGLSTCKQNRWLCIFLGIATFSIIMPVIFAKDIQIMNIDGEIAYSHFTSSNITQLIYLWFCFVFFIYCYRTISNNSDVDNEKLINWYIYGLIFVSFVCMYQIFAIRLGLPFDSLFRQSTHGNTQGTRIYGPCIEASMLCYYLVSTLPICIRWVKKFWVCIITLVNIALGIYSFSSTYVVGLILWIALELADRARKRKDKFKKKYFLLVFILTPIIMMGAIKNQYYMVVAWNKLLDTFMKKNISGIQRNYSFKLLIDAFMKSPILGVGFGSCRGNDLLSTWLSSVGVAGIIPITLFVGEKIIKTKCAIEFKFANAIIWVAMLISVPEPYNLFVWMLLAFTRIADKRKLKEESLKNV